jgi:hypothetical protein
MLNRDISALIVRLLNYALFDGQLLMWVETAWSGRSLLNLSNNWGVLHKV